MQEEIFELIEGKKYARLRELLSDMNPADIAQILEDVEERELPVIFRILPKELAAEVFVEMDSEMQQLLIEAFSDTELREVMDELFMDDTVDIIDEMPATVAKRILGQTDAKTRKMINQLLAYPDDSAGSIMTTEYVDLKKHMTVDMAFDRIRAVGLVTEAIYTCYVIDASRHLLGIVTVKDLLLNQKDCVISNIMDENVIYANTLDDKEEVAGQFEKYDLMALPVVDKENRLVGVVTVDDAIDVIQEEATEDIEKMAAILPSDKTYFRTSVFSTFKARIPWLLLLMISATFTGAIISGFEEKLTVFPALIAFIPMLMDTGGNAGSQASVTIIRGLALHEVEFKDILKVLWKEVRVSVLLGLTLSVACFAKLMLINQLYDQLDIAFVICFAMFITVVLAKVIGCTLPLLAKKCKLDPAVVASPFITTIVDALALIIYCNIALALLA